MRITSRFTGLIVLFIACLVITPRADWRAGASGSRHPSQHLKPLKRITVLPVIVYQPNSPITFQDVQIVAADSGSGSAFYRIKNISSQPILSYRVVAMYAGGGYVRFQYPALGGAPPFLPGEIRPDQTLSGTEFLDSQPIPADERDSIQVPAFLMVVRATMADGCVFDDQKAYEVLEDYRWKLAELTDTAKK
jgi:hypothetical protein